jgi:hypothetical protein
MKYIYDGDKKYSIEVNKSELNFILYCRHLKFGEISNLQIYNGTPISMEETKKSVLFDKMNDFNDKLDLYII